MTEQEHKLKKAYSERNYVAIIAAKFALKAGHKAGWQRDDNEDWDEEWRMTIVIQGDTGQISYHMSPAEYGLAKAELPEFDGKWDGTWLGRKRESVLIINKE